MQTTIALLRGINVGGNNKLPMRSLVEILAALHLQEIQTYIQSGNVVFQTPSPAIDLADRIADGIAAVHGFRPHVLVLPAATFVAIAGANPFPAAIENPATLHVYFLASAPTAPDRPLLDKLKRESEQYVLHDAAFYLYAPDGIGRSKLAERVERALGVTATARNWRTVSMLLALATEVV